MNKNILPLIEGVFVNNYSNFVLWVNQEVMFLKNISRKYY